MAQTELAIEKSVLTIEQLAERWGVHQNTIRRRIQCGAIPSHIIGKGHKISIKWIEAYEDGEKTQKPVAEYKKDDDLAKMKRQSEVLEAENRLVDAKIKKVENERRLLTLEGVVTDARKLAALKQEIEKDKVGLEELRSKLAGQKKELEMREDALDRDEEQCEIAKEELEKGKQAFSIAMQEKEKRVADHEAAMVVREDEIRKREEQANEEMSKLKDERKNLERTEQKINKYLELMRQWRDAQGLVKKKHIADRLLGY